MWNQCVPLALTRCTDNLDDHSTVCIDFEPNRTKVIITCAGPYVAEILSLLAWLGAACRSSPDTRRTCYTSARLQLALDPEAPSHIAVNIRYDFDHDQRTDGFQCWRSLFRGANVATRFPIQSRTPHFRGLELAADLLYVIQQDLISPRHFTAPILPGSWTATAQFKSNTMWHFVADDVYERATTCKRSDPGYHVGWVSDRDVAHSRHFVGWTSDAVVVAGE